MWDNVPLITVQVRNYGIIRLVIQLHATLQWLLPVILPDQPLALVGPIHAIKAIILSPSHFHGSMEFSGGMLSTDLRSLFCFIPRASYVRASGSEWAWYRSCFWSHTTHTSQISHFVLNIAFTQAIATIAQQHCHRSQQYVRQVSVTRKSKSGAR